MLLSALEFADASECVSEGYAGVEDDLVGAFATADDLESDVAKGCLKALRLYKDRPDVLYGAMKTTTRAAERWRPASVPASVTALCYG